MGILHAIARNNKSVLSRKIIYCLPSNTHQVLQNPKLDLDQLWNTNQIRRLGQSITPSFAVSSRNQTGGDPVTRGIIGSSLSRIMLTRFVNPSAISASPPWIRNAARLSGTSPLPRDYLDEIRLEGRFNWGDKSRERGDERAIDLEIVGLFFNSFSCLRFTFNEMLKRSRSQRQRRHEVSTCFFLLLQTHTVLLHPHKSYAAKKNQALVKNHGEFVPFRARNSISVYPVAG